MITRKRSSVTKAERIKIECPRTPPNFLDQSHCYQGRTGIFHSNSQVCWSCASLVGHSLCYHLSIPLQSCVNAKKVFAAWKVVSVLHLTAPPQSSALKWDEVYCSWDSK